MQCGLGITKTVQNEVESSGWRLQSMEHSIRCGRHIENRSVECRQVLDPTCIAST